MVTEPAATSQLDLDAVEEWISILHGASDGYVHICSTLSWTGRAFAANAEMEAIRRYVTQLDQNGAKGIYLRLTTIKTPQLQPGERGSVEDSHTLPGLWADLDIAGPGHKTNKPLPPNEDAARRIITESGLPEPSIWMHSGGGMYAWWLLDNPIDVTDEQVRESSQDFSTRWQNVLTATAERIGYSYGGLGDLSRVTRIPGTVNRKIEDAPTMCRMLDSTARLYSATELADALRAAEIRVTQLAPKPKTPSIPAPRPSTEGTGERPGDELANRMSWEEILEPHGYQFDRTQGVETYWVRPGKHRRDGHSCTTNYGGSGLLYVFSTEMDGFEANESYTKFAAWSILNGYGRQFGAAAKALRAQGYGSQRQAPPPLQAFQPGEAPDGGGATPPVDTEPARAPQVHDFALTDLGAAELMAAMHGHRFRYVSHTDEWMYWDGEVWKVDRTRAVNRAVQAATKMIVEHGWALTDTLEDHDEAAKVCPCKGCRLVKHGIASQSRTKTKGIIGQFGDLAGIAAAPEDFDDRQHLVTVGNGVLDLEARELLGFQSNRMLTKRMNAVYDPDAKCPKFERFMEQVLPSAELRDYVQRALGYTLTGENDQRALFLVHGPSGTGKSQFLRIMELLFGDFGGTAEANTFRKTRSESTHDLHALRGTRFVTTSETSDSAQLDEELVKRVTGGDNVTTRALYQGLQTWRPNFTIWMATNFPPKMNSDDGAVWARYKPIHFGQQFSKSDGTDIPNIGQRIFEEEASGILNWLLAGLAAYRARGLGEPQEVVEQVAEHRLDSDNVAQFVADSVDEGRLVKDPAAQEIKSSQLYQAYQEWATRERVYPLGQKRFSLRMETLGYERKRSNGIVWVGLRFGPGTGFLGSMG